MGSCLAEGAGMWTWVLFTGWIFLEEWLFVVLLSSCGSIKVFITATVCFKILCGWVFIAQEWCQMDSPEDQSPHAIYRTQVWHKQWHMKFSFCLSLSPAWFYEAQIEKRAPQGLCLFRGTNNRTTYWGGRMGDIWGISVGLSPEVTWDQTLGNFLKHLLS